MKKKTIKKRSFENALIELEKILDDVERANLTIDELVDCFEKGTELSNYCLDEIKNAKLKISTFKKDSK